MRRSTPTTQQRQRNALAAIPWVTQLKRTYQCEAFTTRAPGWVYRHPAQDGWEQWLCRKPARWSFTALKRSFAQSGRYCTEHVISRGIHGDPNELDRLERWIQQLPDTSPLKKYFL